MYKIALLTYPFLLSWFEEAILPFRSQLTIDIIPFERQHQLLELIPSLSAQYDGLCVFSASVNGFLQQSRQDINKPIVYLDRYSVDFFKAFFIMLNDNREADFTRIFLDTSLIRPDTMRSLEYIVRDINLFEENQTRYLQDIHFDDFYNLEATIEENALRFWHEDRFDILICRIASVASLMRKENIPYIFVYPEKQRIVEALENLINRIRLDKQMDGLPASIMISLTDDIRKEYHEISQESIRIQKALLEFGKNYSSNYTIQFTSQGYEILTSHSTVQRITSELTCCQLGYFLFSTLGIAFRIGYGIGLNISSARQNAFYAVKSAADTGFSCVMTEDGRSIPLQVRPSSSDMPGQSNTSSYLSSRTGLSPITLQRISSALLFLGTNDVTNHELAEALQVTVANANRFLNSLVKSGHAEITETKKSSAKGRPSRIYRIQL